MSSSLIPAFSTRYRMLYTRHDSIIYNPRSPTLESLGDERATTQRRFFDIPSFPAYAHSYLRFFISECKRWFVFRWVRRSGHLFFSIFSFYCGNFLAAIPDRTYSANCLHKGSAVKLIRAKNSREDVYVGYIIIRKTIHTCDWKLTAKPRIKYCSMDQIHTVPTYMFKAEKLVGKHEIGVTKRESNADRLAEARNLSSIWRYPLKYDRSHFYKSQRASF